MPELRSLREAVPDDKGFKTWWFTVPHHRRARLEQLVDTARILQGHATHFEVVRGQHELWVGLRKNAGYPISVLATHIGVDHSSYSRWETGNRGISKQKAITYGALLQNIAGDLYHRAITRLTWELYWTERKKNAPEQVDATDSEYLEWVTNHAATHPLLEELPHSIPYNPRLEWPLPKN
jgi:transcriptional regulator with XRE-family HTH domain